MLYLIGLLVFLFVVGTVVIFGLGRLNPNLFPKSNIRHVSYFVLEQMKKNGLISADKKNMTARVRREPKHIPLPDAK